MGSARRYRKQRASKLSRARASTVALARAFFSFSERSNVLKHVKRKDCETCMHANETTGGGGAAQLHESSRAAEAACTSEGRPDHSVHSQCLQMADPSSKLRNISSTVANGTRLREKRKKKEKFFSFSNNVHSVHSQGLQMADPSFFQDFLSRFFVF